MLQRLVDAYECEWAAVVRDPEKRKRFRQFANTDETESCIEFVSERGQCRPADWTNELVSLETYSDLTEKQRKISSNGGAELLTQTRWVTVGRVDDFPRDGGATIKYGKTQIAVFHFASRGQWYASQNMCPHKKAFVLSSGILGDGAGVPKIACPLHKRTFSLDTGESLQGEDYAIRTFPARVVGDEVQLELPPTEVLDKLLATEIGCALATTCRHEIAAPDDRAVAQV
jgi:nitrite reductase (NADH) large subunit